MIDLDAANTQRLTCGHFFCLNCVTEWFERQAAAAKEAGEDVQQSGTCPTCRQTAEDAAESTFCATMAQPREMEEAEAEEEEVEDDEAFARAMASTLAANAANVQAAIVLPALVSANNHRGNTGRVILNPSGVPPTRRGSRQPTTNASVAPPPRISELRPLSARAAAAAANPTSMQAAPPLPHASQSVHGSLLQQNQDRGGSSIPERPGGSSQEATEGKYFRTRMCTFFVERGYCAKGELCHFAHSADQLRSAASLSKGKGQISEAVSSGTSFNDAGTLTT